VRVTSIAFFGVGYVLGAKAGRDRYAEIVEAARKATQGLDQYRRAGGGPSDKLASYLRDGVDRASHS
jgi:hypothetical protein